MEDINRLKVVLVEKKRTARTAKVACRDHISRWKLKGS